MLKLVCDDIVNLNLYELIIELLKYYLLPQINISILEGEHRVLFLEVAGEYLG